MCDVGPQAGACSGVCSAGAPRSVGEALGMVMAGLGWLADADLAGLPGSVRAECLRGLERVRSVQTAAHAAVLSAFDADGGYAEDGQGTSRAWLRWQTRVTGGAAAGAVGWMRRLRAHPVVRGALRAGEISESWGRQICAWTDLLPESARQDADAILLAAAAGGAELADLASLVEQMRGRLARPDHDSGDDGFDDRRVRLAATIGGAGRLDGDLTPGCAAALAAVLEALGKKAGPEDTRTQGQRWHDVSRMRADGSSPLCIMMVSTDRMSRSGGSAGSLTLPAAGCRGARAVAAARRASCRCRPECHVTFPWQHRVQRGQARWCRDHRDGA